MVAPGLGFEPGLGCELLMREITVIGAYSCWIGSCDFRHPAMQGISFGRDILHTLE